MNPLRVGTTVSHPSMCVCGGEAVIGTLCWKVKQNIAEICLTECLVIEAMG